MTDAVQPTSAPDAVPVSETKTKGLRGLRDRIALRRSFSTKQPSLSSPNLTVPVELVVTDIPEDAAPLASPKSTKSTTMFDWLKPGKLGAKKGAKKSSDGAAVPVLLEATATTSTDSSHPQTDGTLATVPEAEDEPTEVRALDANPDALLLAQKIESLLSAVPPFLTSITPPTDGSPSATPDPLPNARLLAMLSSPQAMNGTPAAGQDSVFATLDNLRVLALKASLAKNAKGPSMVDDADGIMFYGPLMPGDDSEVELARSQIVRVDEHGKVLGVVSDSAVPLPSSADQTPGDASLKVERWDWHWPFYHPDAASTSTPPPIKKRVWLPSTEKLSLQVMWWGFRLWLPPPVMASLDNKEIEVGKISSVLATALNWLVGHIPDSAVPPALAPAFRLVKSLVPYVGYIGGFVAWSWGELKSFDVGYGVTLTATWLLPIALIPGTWEKEDVPVPPAATPPDGSSPAGNAPPATTDSPTTTPSKSEPSATPAAPTTTTIIPTTTSEAPPAEVGTPSGDVPTLGLSETKSVDPSVPEDTTVGVDPQDAAE